MNKPDVQQMIPLKEAAKRIGYTPKGLRDVVARSRARARGRPTAKPVIRFFQRGKGGGIYFKPEWIDQFIAENTVDPFVPLTPLKKQKKKARTRKHSRPRDPGHHIPPELCGP